MKSLAELQAIKEKMQGQVNLRDNDKSVRVVVGMATCGIAAGARPVLQAFSDLVQKNGLNDVSVTQTGCIGLCQYEPIVEITRPGEEKITYINMDADKAKEVVEQHLMRGVVVADYTINSSGMAK
ncbi:MAG: (2Fe-2S) ferredoxin domain-containing protein [Oscillospiraceae bacterium]|jgi:NADP-reducing hydrogenase subunit HndB|nr:(2Fe-2S) ferredoxin domain-containing protein [Oscillospiraceae bacterium]